MTPRRTVNSQIAKRGASSSLHFGVMAAEKEQNGVERMAANGAHFLLRNLCKGKRSASLEIDIVRKRKCGQCLEGGTREEVG